MVCPSAGCRYCDDRGSQEYSYQFPHPGFLRRIRIAAKHSMLLGEKGSRSIASSVAVLRYRGHLGTILRIGHLLHAADVSQQIGSRPEAGWHEGFVQPRSLRRSFGSFNVESLYMERSLPLAVSVGSKK
jgi:hypothetical protein